MKKRKKAVRRRAKKYRKVQKLSEKEFRRLVGVKKETFKVMIRVLKDAEKKRKKLGGKPPTLAIEDRLLMSLEYMREYRTYFHLGQSYGLSESSCYRNCRWVEDTLIKSRKFKLPGRKAVQQSDQEYEIILIDASETPIERPKKSPQQTKDQKPQ